MTDKKIIKTNIDKIIGTSFWGVTLTTTLNDLMSHFRDPYLPDFVHTGTHAEYYLELPDGTVFTLYDYDRSQAIERDDLVQWHIGAFSRYDAQSALDALIALLRK